MRYADCTATAGYGDIVSLIPLSSPPNVTGGSARAATNDAHTRPLYGYGDGDYVIRTRDFMGRHGDPRVARSVPNVCEENCAVVSIPINTVNGYRVRITSGSNVEFVGRRVVVEVVDTGMGNLEVGTSSA